MAILALTVIAATGCYYLKYDKLMRTHVGVLLDMTRKIEDVTERAGNVPASLTEYRYPLERAEDFARIAARRFEGRASLQAFRELCAAYDRLLATADRVRGGDRGSNGAAPALAEAAAAVRAAATQVVQALDRERDGSVAAPG